MGNYRVIICSRRLSLLVFFLLLLTCTVLSLCNSWASLLPVVEYFSTTLLSSDCCIEVVRLVIRLQNKLEALQVTNIYGAGCSLYS